MAHGQWEGDGDVDSWSCHVVKDMNANTGGGKERQEFWISGTGTIQTTS